ncbi:hypothetical protein NFJ02_27g64300 [Pycnococcus provasolii]
MSASASINASADVSGSFLEDVLQASTSRVLNISSSTPPAEPHLQAQAQVVVPGALPSGSSGSPLLEGVLPLEEETSASGAGGELEEDSASAAVEELLNDSASSSSSSSSSSKLPASVESRGGEVHDSAPSVGDKEETPFALVHPEPAASAPASASQPRDESALGGGEPSADAQTTTTHEQQEKLPQPQEETGILPEETKRTDDDDADPELEELSSADQVPPLRSESGVPYSMLLRDDSVASATSEYSRAPSGAMSASRSFLSAVDRTHQKERVNVADVLESTMGVTQYHKSLHKLPTGSRGLTKDDLTSAQRKLLYMISRLTTELEVTDFDTLEMQDALAFERKHSIDRTNRSPRPSRKKKEGDSSNQSSAKSIQSQASTGIGGSQNNSSENLKAMNVNRPAAIQIPNLQDINASFFGPAIRSDFLPPALVDAGDGMVTDGSSSGAAKSITLKSVAKKVTSAVNFTKRAYRPSGERWIRRINLLVYIYEAAVAQLFSDYDYAPGVEFNGNAVVPLNVCQEGLDDLYDLKEAGYLLQLNMASRSHRIIAAYQLSSRARRLLDLPGKEGGVTDAERYAVDIFFAKWLSTADIEECKAMIEEAKFMHKVPMSDRRKVYAVRPFEVRQVNEHFEILNSDFRRWSTVTHFEDVSYVCSPYLPDVLTPVGGRAPHSDEELRAEAVEAVQRFGESNIRDSSTDVNLCLSGIQVVFAKWIPTGNNEINAMQKRCTGFGHRDDSKSGPEALVSGRVDREIETNSVIELAMSDLAAVYPMASTPGVCCTFEAHVYLPEDEGVLQVERFGLHCHAAGDVVFSAKVDAVMTYGENSVPIDLFSRALLDMHEDSNHIISTMVSRRQRELLETLAPLGRRRYSTYIAMSASSANPALKAADYMDGEALENELRQVLGEILQATDLNATGSPGVLLVGLNGVLIICDQRDKYESALVLHAQLMSRITLCDTIFHRIFELDDSLESIRKKVHSYRGRSSDLHEIRDLVTTICRSEASLQSILYVVDQSIATFEEEQASRQKRRIQDGIYAGPEEELARVLGTSELIKDLRLRIVDLQTHLDSFNRDLQSLRDNANVISERQMFRLQENLQNNTRSLENLFRANESSSSSLYILQAVLGGSLAFSVLDRVTGEFTIKDSKWGKAFFDAIVLRPGLWFGLSLLAFCVAILSLEMFMKRLVKRAAAVASMRIDLLAEVRPKNMQRMMESIAVKSSDINAGVDGRHVQTFVWDEPRTDVPGEHITVELSYDSANRLLLNLQLRYNKFSGTLTERDLCRQMMAKLVKAGIFVRNPELESYLSGLIPESSSVWQNELKGLRNVSGKSTFSHSISSALTAGWKAHVTIPQISLRNSALFGGSSFQVRVRPDQGVVVRNDESLMSPYRKDPVKSPSRTNMPPWLATGAASTRRVANMSHRTSFELMNEMKFERQYSDDLEEFAENPHYATSARTVL